MKNLIIAFALVVGLLSIGYVLQSDAGHRIVPVSSPTLLATSSFLR